VQNSVLKLRPPSFFLPACHLIGTLLPCLLLAGCAGEFRASSDSTLKTPLVIWITPAAIPYGTALGVAQLNAVASVPGSFAYTPALGTILIVGAQTLSV